MSAKAECEEKIQELMAKGKTRDEAARLVFKRYPDLQQRMIDEANADRQPPRRRA
jgi:uncharacterized protein YoaH (UPF0181 family)